MALSEGPVLVIGAAGCIGAQVVAKMVRDGPDVNSLGPACQ